jgi:hypothetical protein
MAKQLVRQKTNVPDRKVGYAALAATAASIGADLIVGNVDAFAIVDPDQLEALIVGLITLATGYFVRSADNG